MNLAAVARMLAGFALFFSLAQAIPLVLALVEDEGHEFDARAAFTGSLAAGAVLAFALWLLGRRCTAEFYRREGLAVVGLAWIGAAALGAVPFVWAGALAPVDAWFESVSGLTTTGASILGAAGITPAIEALPDSLLLWRAMLQWFGGMGIILVFLVLLPAMGVTGKNLLSSEQIGIADSSQRPRLQEQARALFTVYVVLTATEAVLLRAVGMERWFDCICHAFTTMASGGFSTRNASIAAFDSVAIELVIVFFMFLAGTSFALLLALAKSRFRDYGSLWGSPEFRLYLGLTVGLIIANTLILFSWGEPMHDAASGGMKDYGDFGTCLRDATFSVVSLLTSTGYGSSDYQNWPHPAILLMMMSMFIGGCSGSTAGGVKVVRALVVCKLIGYTVRHYLRPKSVEKVKVGSTVVPNGVISSIVTLVLMAGISILVGAFVLAFDSRLDFTSALTSSLSMIGCTGPALTDVHPIGDGAFEVVNRVGINVGPCGTFGTMTALSKITMTCLMLLGRLELLALIVLVLPGLWRR